MGISKRIASRVPLILSTMALTLFTFLTNSAIAEVAAAYESAPYQSSFEEYKSLTDENIADWKVLNQQAITSEKPMPNMSDGSDMSNMPGMDMGKSSTKSGSSDMSNMEGMDHSKMPGMKMGDKNAKSDSSDMSNMPGMDMGKSSTKSGSYDMSNMEGMDHSKMPSMKMGDKNTKSTSSDMSNMPGMDMGKSSATSTEIENRVGIRPDTKSDMASMEGMDHSEMKGANSASSPKNAPGFQIIPNFHPFAVHFPIVLIISAFLFSLAASVLRKHPLASQLASTGHLSLWAAAPAAIVAAIAGWIAFNSVNHDEAGHAAMLVHRAWAIPTAVSILLFAGWDIWKHRLNQMMSIPMLLMLGLLLGVTLATGWLGGEVVYRHGIGVMSIPAKESSEISGHQHGGPKADEQVNPPVKSAPSSEGESHAH